MSAKDWWGMPAGSAAAEPLALSGTNRPPACLFNGNRGALDFTTPVHRALSLW